MTLFSAVPSARGLYDPRFEHDSCGVAFVATMTAVPEPGSVVLLGGFILLGLLRRRRA